MSSNANLTLLFDHQSEADAAHVLSMNGCLSSAGLAIKAGGSPIAKFANTVTYQINGKVYTKTTADLALPAIVVADDEMAIVAWFLDAAGNTTSASSDVVAKTADVPALPAFADNKVCIGAVKIVNETGAGFTGATTALDVSGLTVSYYNFGTAFSGMAV